MLNLKRCATFILLLVILTFVSAQPPFQNIGQAGESRYIIEFPKIETAAYLHDFNFYAHVYFSNGTAITNGLTNETVTCHLHGYNQSGVETYDKIMNYSDDDWTAYVPDSFFNWIGEGYYVVWCMDDMNISGATSNPFIITPTGEMPTIQKLISNIILLISIIGIMILIHFKSQSIDYKSWEDSIRSGNKNTGQVMVSGLVYSLFKNTFVWFYFLGWLFVLVLKTIVNNFGSLEVYEYFELIANTYSIGLLLVTVFMIGFTIHFIRKSFDVLADKNWGVGDYGK